MSVQTRANLGVAVFLLLLCVFRALCVVIFEIVVAESLGRHISNIHATTYEKTVTKGQLQIEHMLVSISCLVWIDVVFRLAVPTGKYTAAARTDARE